MGMCLGLRTISNSNIQTLLRDPELIWLFFSPDDPEAYLRAKQNAVKNGFLATLFGKNERKNNIRVPELILGEGEGDEEDLDKAWHGIHFLLTGTAWEGEFPSGILVAGGEAIGDIDVGYGPARAFTSTQVEQIHQYLSAIDERDLAERFDPQAMTAQEIYPDSLWERDGDEALQYCVEYFATLKAFIEAASNRQFGILVYHS